MTYDHTISQTFEYLEYYFNSVKQDIQKMNPMIFLVANKNDLANHKQSISVERVRALAEKWAAVGIASVSAKDNTDCQEFFNEMLSVLLPWIMKGIDKREIRANNIALAQEFKSKLEARITALEKGSEYPGWFADLRHKIDKNIKLEKVVALKALLARIEAIANTTYFDAEPEKVEQVIVDIRKQKPEVDKKVIGAGKSETARLLDDYLQASKLDKNSANITALFKIIDPYTHNV